MDYIRKYNLGSNGIFGILNIYLSIVFYYKSKSKFSNVVKILCCDTIRSGVCLYLLRSIIVVIKIERALQFYDGTVSMKSSC